MNKKIFFNLLTLSSLIFCDISASSLWQGSNAQIAVNNRVLAKINGKAFSVIDLMKKMELVFYREYPEYADSAEAKIQFFKSQWKYVLDELIDAELILASSKEMNMSVSDGDVRQEIERIFGPNVVDNIDKLGMSYEEVFKMLASDITVQRMTYSMAQMQAMNKIGPSDVRASYEQFCKENPIEEEWSYRVITLKGSHKDNLELTAELCHALLEQKSSTLDELSTFLEDKQLISKEINVSVSEPFIRQAKTVSTAHKEILTSLTPETFSKPIFSESTGQKKQLSAKIFYIEKYQAPGVHPLKEVEARLKNKLLEKAIDEETVAYRQKLRKRFGIEPDFLAKKLPINFEPFILVRD